MSHSTLSDYEMATREMTALTGVKPGLFQRRRSDAESRNRKVPLAITLPVTMAVSSVLWAGIFLAIRALFW